MSTTKILQTAEAEFDQTVREAWSLVDFWAPWCGPCRMQIPVLEQFAAMHPDLKVVKVNVDQAPGLAQRFGVMSIPLLVFLQDGREVHRLLGVHQLGQLQAELRTLQRDSLAGGDVYAKERSHD